MSAFDILLIIALSPFALIAGLFISLLMVSSICCVLCLFTANAAKLLRWLAK